MSDKEKAFELTGLCDHCRKTDGRATSAFAFTNKGGRLTELCAECAELTKAAHEIEPARAQRNKPGSDRAAQADAGETQAEKGTSAALGGGETQVPAKS